MFRPKTMDFIDLQPKTPSIQGQGRHIGLSMRPSRWSRLSDPWLEASWFFFGRITSTVFELLPSLMWRRPC